MVEIFKALSDENRIRIVNLLLQRDLCVCDIEGILGLSQSNVSRHLIKLKSSGIIAQEKKAQWVFHRIDDKFKMNHKTLINYLNEQVSSNPQCLNDIDRLQSFTVTCLNTDDWCK